MNVSGVGVPRQSFLHSTIYLVVVYIAPLVYRILSLRDHFSDLVNHVWISAASEEGVCLIGVIHNQGGLRCSINRFGRDCGFQPKARCAAGGSMWEVCESSEDLALRLTLP